MDAELIHRETTEPILKAFYRVYNAHRYGFLESVYKRSMVVALRNSGLICEIEKPFTVFFDRENVGEYRCDLLVESRVIVEVKTAARIESGHLAQCLNYLKAAKVEVGLVLNFGEKPEFKRVVLSRR